MKTAVVIPNLNGEDHLKEAIDSILSQTYPNTLIVVDNASSDRSFQIIQQYQNKLVLLKNGVNLGFTGGVNPGIQYAIDHKFEAVALFNNDALADNNWLKNLAEELKDERGIVTGKLLSFDKTFVDTTGECMTNWGLAYPRGRGILVKDDVFKSSEFVFGATGGASLYSIKMLKDIGLFDQRFFAYYEDVDISFRAQLAGWKVWYTPKAIAYHRISQTSRKMYRGFSVYHSFKNMPLVVYKNLPLSLRHGILRRFWIAYISFFIKACARGFLKEAVRGLYDFRRYKKDLTLSHQSVTDEYIFSIITKGPPPGAHGLNILYNLFHGKI